MLETLGKHANLVITIVCYMTASAGMSIFNKLAVVHLPLPLTIVSIQMAFTVATLVIKPSQLQYGGRQDLLKWGLTVPVLFVGMLATSMLAMQYASLGTIVVFRNIAPIPTMLIECMFRIPFMISKQTVAALLLIIVGVVIYEQNEINFSVLGLSAIVINMVFAVLERIMQRHLMANNPVDLAKPTMMILNNGVGMLPCFLLAISWGEHKMWHERFGALDKAGVIFLIISCVNGVLISYAGLRLQQMVAATTFMVITNVNKFGVIAFGIIAFKDSASWSSLVGCCLAIMGGVFYAEARKRAEAANQAQAEPELRALAAHADDHEEDEDDK